MKILAVDDDPVFREILNLVLVEDGYEDVTLAEDAAHALELILDADLPFECFLIDMVMPKMDGVALCKKIRSISRYKLTPILMVTALADEMSVDRAFIAGANDFVTKPLNTYEIIGRVRSAGILVQQTKKKLALEKTVGQLEATVITLSTKRSDDEIEVVFAPHCEPIMRLEDMLCSLPSGVYAMSCFAIRISEIGNLLGRLSEAEVGVILTDVATHISAELGLLHHRLAYYGNGIFGGVVFGRRARLKTEKGLNWLGIEQTIAGATGMGEASTLTLRLHEEPTTPLLTGLQAVKAIRDAVVSLRQAIVPTINEESDSGYLPFCQDLGSRTSSNVRDVENISHNIFL